MGNHQITLPCPMCKMPSRIMTTYSPETGSVLHRVRKCSLNHQFMTIETIIDDPPSQDDEADDIVVGLQNEANERGSGVTR